MSGTTATPTPTVQWQRVTYRYDNAESQRWWGVGENNVTTTRQAPTRRVGDVHVRQVREPKGKVSDLTYQTTDYNPDADTPEIVEVDVGDYTLVRINDPAGPCLTSSACKPSPGCSTA